MRKKLVITAFPEEREILIEDEVSNGKLISRALRKEILMLYQLGLEEYEIKFLLALKEKGELGAKWRD